MGNKVKYKKRIGALKMEQYYIIKFPPKITSRFFYKELLPEIRNYRQNRDNYKKRLLLDFGEVDIVNALVVPNLLMLGHQLRVQYEVPPLIYIPTKRKLLAYLDEIAFFQFARRFSIFEFFEEYIGDYKTNPAVERRTYYIPNKSEPEEIWTLLDESISIIREAYDNRYEIYRNETALNIKKSLWEICKNSVIHGGSFAFVTIQKEKGINKVMISEADTGKGIYESLKRKIIEDPAREQLHFISNEKFLSLEKNIDREVYAIIEAAFYRKDKEYYIKRGLEIEYGVWDIIHSTLKKNKDGKVRIHSKNRQIIFTCKFMNDYFSTEILKRIYTSEEEKDNEKHDKLDSKEFFDLIRKICESMYVNRFSSLYYGVHIEVEV